MVAQAALDPHRHQAERDLSPRAPQDWIPRDLLNSKIDELGRTISGEVCEVSRIEVDHGEAGSQSKGFKIYVRPTRYADSFATPLLLNNSDVLWRPVKERIETVGIVEALKTSPDRSLFVNLTVSTKGGQVLVTRRSASVASAVGLRSLGVQETMNKIPDSPGHAPENLFDLARRAAREEVGLDAEDYGPIWFTWFGFGRSHGQFVVAHIQSHLEAPTIVGKARNSEGGYEADAIEWLNIRGEQMQLLATMRPHSGWLPLTTIAARGLLDIWPHLASEPRRF